jgi:hypothetical protein
LKKTTDLIHKVLLEANAYTSMGDIEKLVEKGVSLSSVPVQPLYFAIQKAPSDQVSALLPKLSKTQRQALLDIDIWQRDQIDPSNFGYWIEAYLKCEDDSLGIDFSQSDDFLLLFKSRLNIYTFDIEDPMYPDHDNYFLTEDNLLLVEYDDEFQYVNELKSLIQKMYSELGVENAYAHLFKMVSDSYMVWEEEAYHHKKERLRDFGFVDYIEALENLNPFRSFSELERFIKNKTTATGNLDPEVANQTLHSNVIVSFNEGLSSLHEEASKLNDAKREQFLQFAFVRMINSTLTLNDGLKSSSLELKRLSDETKAYLELGCEYLKSQWNKSEFSLFEDYDFFDFYRVGKSLININKSGLKKNLALYQLDSDQAQVFLGTWFSQFVEDTFLAIPKAKAFGAGAQSQLVDNLKVYRFWCDQIQQLTELLPFVKGFYNTYQELVKKELIQDHFYLNYDVESIDFEALMITSILNFKLDKVDEDNKKMGLLRSELEEIISFLFKKAGEEYYLYPMTSEVIDNLLTRFIEKFGLQNVFQAKEYFYGILGEHLNGYEWDQITIEDMAHIGGPILLAEK